MSHAAAVTEHPVLSGLRAAAAALDRDDPTGAWRLGDDDVEAALAGVLALESRVAALGAVLLLEADTRGLRSRTRASSTERWLGDRFRLSHADSAARLRAAAALGRHPGVLEALAAGGVSPEQAVVVTGVLDRVRILPGLSEGEPAQAAMLLVESAAALGPRDLARAGQAVVEALTRTPSVDDPADAAALERAQERAAAADSVAERNELRLSRRHGRLRATLELGGLGEAVLTGWLRTVDAPVPGEDGFADDRPIGQRRGDALVDLLARARPDGAGACSEPSALLTVTTTLADLRAALTGTGHLDTGTAVHASSLRQLACDALVIPAVLGGPSQVLDLGRATRVWNMAQRRGVALRDRGCVAPGCTRPPAACQNHHAWHWADGGPTDQDNAALLCGFHHRMVHRQGWAVTLAANGYPQLTPPASVDPQRRPRQHHRFRMTRLTLLTGRHRP